MIKKSRKKKQEGRKRRGGRERSEGKRGKRRERGGKRRERKVSPSASFASGESNEKESTAVCVP